MCVCVFAEEEAAAEEPAAEGEGELQSEIPAEQTETLQDIQDDLTHSDQSALSFSPPSEKMFSSFSTQKIYDLTKKSVLTHVRSTGISLGPNMQRVFDIESFSSSPAIQSEESETPRAERTKSKKLSSIGRTILHGRASDWICNTCSTSNVGSRARCHACRVPRPTNSECLPQSADHDEPSATTLSETSLDSEAKHETQTSDIQSSLLVSHCTTEPSSSMTTGSTSESSLVHYETSPASSLIQSESTERREPNRDDNQKASDSDTSDNSYPRPQSDHLAI